MTTLYRANARQEWQAVSVVCALPYGRVLGGSRGKD